MAGPQRLDGARPSGPRGPIGPTDPSGPKGPSGPIPIGTEGTIGGTTCQDGGKVAGAGGKYPPIGAMLISMGGTPARDGGDQPDGQGHGNDGLLACCRAGSRLGLVFGGPSSSGKIVATDSWPSLSGEVGAMVLASSSMAPTWKNPGSSMDDLVAFPTRLPRLKFVW